MPTFHVWGTAYEIPVMAEMSTKEAKLVKEATGMGFRKLSEGLDDLDGEAFAAVAYVAKLRAGEKVSWKDLEELRPMVDIVWPEAEEEEGKSNPPTDGSTESGTSPTRGSKTTSRSSRTTSTSTPDK